jgi:MYXO-CTERM domain-containing protein
MVGSTALPHVARALPAMLAMRLPAGPVASAAAAWLGAAGHRVAARAFGAEPVIVAVVHARGAGEVDIDYALAEQVTMESTTATPGRWNVFIDATTGTAFARQSQLMFGTGAVMFDVPDRAPRATAGRHPQPAAHDTHMVNGAAMTSTADGTVSWAGTGTATVLPGLSGPLVAVTNRAGSLVTAALAIPTGGTATWSRATDEATDAQLDAFIYANQVKQFAKARLDPTLAYLDQQLSVNVNETSGSCNAYSTGDDLHFFPQTPGLCENTGRMADVVYHEFGHSLHRHSIIPGVGQFDGGMSEGVADTLAVSMLGDPGFARGFRFDDAPLRQLNPLDKKVWPRDADGEVHDDGEIYGETMWDLRANLETHLGNEAGFAQFLQIYYSTVQRAVDIPSCFAEALVADDDDGDLANGTPHDCDIIAAFAAHGLFDPGIIGGVAAPVRNGFVITVDPPPQAVASCHAPSVVSGEVRWRLRGSQSEQVPLALTDGTLAATIPTQPDGSVVEYAVRLALSSGAVQSFPDNLADPFYQFYVGKVTPIWCADFETGAEGWTHDTTPGDQDRWEIAAPSGQGGGPRAAYAGASVLGIALTRGGSYAARATTRALSPMIDLHGNIDVHLQYYRWLGVEDGYYDQATISANDTWIWRNFASAMDPRTGEINHIDREWRFQDIDVSGMAASGRIQLAFGLVSDPGVEAAGWNIDDVCLVTSAPACGNGVVEPSEMCDDGNTASGDGCSSSCQLEAAMDGGCCEVGTGPAAPAGLAVVAMAWLRRRRRPDGPADDQRRASLR